LSEARYSILFDAIPDGVLIVEVHSARVLGFNRVMETLVGRSHEQLAQMKVYDLHPEKDRDFHISHFASLSAKALSSITNARFEARMLRSDGQEIDVEISGRGPFRYGKAQCMVGIVRDISESKKYQQSLEYVAYHDELTGLFNRNGIKRYLTNRREQGQFNDLLVHADIDNFTRINEQYDIEFGNKVLTAFAKQLEGVLPQGSQIARLGGDEFILVVGADLAEGSLAGLILRLMNTLQLPVSVNADTVSLSVSAGIKHFSEEDQANEEVLLRQVAHALYLAKIKGTAQFHLLDQLQEDSERSRNELLNRIEHGLQEQEFELFYQPQIDLHSGNVIGAEALIRWRHPEEGLLSPFHFIPATVNHRVSRLIDNWVLQQSLQQIAQWQQYWPHLKISCNISAMSLQDTTFSDRLDAMLQEYPQVLPSNLGVELLESSAMEDRQATIANLQQLKCRGVCSSIDDFGTGYSSLSYLMQLPIDWLKLDKSFIADMSGEMQNNALIDGVITIGKAFDLSIIAEGIETLEQGTMLINMGCQYGQGYAIARPMPASEFTDWLNQWEPPAVWLEAASHPSK
jgi:diguanylate cyclase (GGDEF)-like protein/PAS domain S-box-containing protein